MAEEPLVPAEVVAAPSEPGDGKTAGRWSRRWVVLAVLLVGGPLLYHGLRGEIAKWHLAVAEEASLEEDWDRAEAAVNQAVAWAPRYLPAYFARIHLYLSLGDADGALVDCDTVVTRARERAGTAPDGFNGDTLMLAHALNTNAYAYALAGRKLEQAEQYAEESVTLLERLPEELRPAELYASARDTRGYVYFLRGKHEEALADVDWAVRTFESVVYPRSRSELYGEKQMVVDRRPIVHAERTLRETHAVLLYHRGLIHEALGNASQAQSDLQRGKRLGYNPQQGVW